MAGTIELPSGQLWSAASWVFDWILRTLAAEVRDPELSGELIGIVDENLGWFSLAELNAERLAEIRRVARTTLVAVSDSKLPLDLPHRSDVIAGVAELVELI